MYLFYFIIMSGKQRIDNKYFNYKVYFLKKYNCWHILAACIDGKYVKMPNNLKLAKIERKKKQGKKQKAKAGESLKR